MINGTRWTAVQAFKARQVKMGIWLTVSVGFDYLLTSVLGHRLGIADSRPPSPLKCSLLLLHVHLFKWRRRQGLLWAGGVLALPWLAPLGLGVRHLRVRGHLLLGRKVSLQLRRHRPVPCPTIDSGWVAAGPSQEQHEASCHQDKGSQL